MKTPKYTPENIRELLPNQVFVFGSNNHARHGKGAAKLAAQKFGAHNYVAEGCVGQSYAIPTVDCNRSGPFRGVPRSLDKILMSVVRFYDYARRNPEREFLVTELGCGLAGWAVKDIAPMFADPPSNVVLPRRFHEFNTPPKP